MQAALPVLGDSPRWVIKPLGWRASVQALAAIALAAVLVAASAPGVGEWSLLAFVAFAPWLASLPRLRWPAATLSGFIMGLAYIIPGRWSTFTAAIGNSGAAGWEQTLWTLAFFATYALPFALFGAFDARLRALAGPQALQTQALLRAAVLSSLICLCWSPFPYTPAAAIVDWLGLLQWTSVGGEPLLLCLMLWPSALLATLWQQSPGPVRSGWAVALLLAALGLATLAGHWRIASMDRAEARGEGLHLSALALQLDLPAYATPTLLTADRPGAAASAVELTRRGYAAAPHCELAIWPETPVDARHGARVCASGQALATATGRPVLLQCQQSLAQQPQITATWLPAAGAVPPTHAKSALVRGYEQPVLGAGQWVAGTPGRVFEIDAYRRLIPVLCYELYAGSHVRQSVLAGGQFIAHMVSFTGFDREPIDRWDQPMARLRAAAFGLPIARAGNRSPIGWIDANGRVRQQSERFGRRADCLALWSPARGPTLYTHLAPVAAWLPALLMLGAIGLRHAVRSPTRRGRPVV